MTPNSQDLLDFWFGELVEGFAHPKQRKLWFEASREFDQQCEQQFAHWLPLTQSGELQPWLDSPNGCLAYIILTDQIPRNVYRGSAQAYAWDALALAAATQGIQDGLDLTLGLDERTFFYMPFEHSEDILNQHLAVGLFTALRDITPKPHRGTMGNTLRFAQQHRDIVLQFGRFPHRNAALERRSTEPEVEFVAGSDGFGQVAKEEPKP